MYSRKCYLRENEGDLSGEFGGINVLLMLFCVLAFLAYAKGGQALMIKHFPPLYNYLFLVILFVVSVFTAGCQLHLIIKGEKSPRQLRRILKGQLSQLNDFIKEIRARIDNVELEFNFIDGLVRPVAYEQLAQLKQLLNALELRCARVGELIARKNRAETIFAAELMGSDLDAFEAGLQTLIQIMPMPPLAPEKWLPRALELIEAIELESKRAARKRSMIKEAA